LPSGDAGDFGKMFKVIQRISSCLILLPLLLAGCGGLSDSGNSAGSTADTNSAAGSSDAKAAFDDGMKALDSGDADRAILSLSKAVEIDPDYADAWFNLGIAYALVEKRDAEISGMTPTPVPGESTPKPAKPNSQKAFEKAVAAYEKIIDADPDNHQAYFNLGLARNKLNEDEAAARALRQAVKLNPEDTEYQTELGAILIKLAQYREAIGPLKKALELDPENVKAQQLLEDAEAGRKRIDYVSIPKDGKNDKNANVNAENPEVSPAANSATNTGTASGTPPAANRNPSKTSPAKSPSAPASKPATKP
jgi:tetratricopeptide (TPR) repeat protein